VPERDADDVATDPEEEIADEGDLEGPLRLFIT
jgi:hypothetical protein